MVKKTLIVMAAVVLLATMTHAAITVVPFTGASGDGEYTGVKVDGSQTVRWPFDYRALVICEMPIRMSLGMFVQVKDCLDKKIILEQIDCSRFSERSGGKISNKGQNEFPCYLDCEKFEVRANFDVKLGTNRVAVGSVIDTDRWSSYYVGTDIVTGNGAWQEVEVCVGAWRVKLWNGTVGDETQVGTLQITAKPNV